MDWSQIPSLAALRAFEAAERHGSFTQAARELNVTHAAIAQHVRALEGEFAQTLVVRQGRGIAATAEGLQLAKGLRAGFGDIAAAVAALRAQVEQRPLALTLTPAFAENWLMPRIADFWAQHPDIAVSINPSLELSSLQNDGFDLSIRFGDGDWPGLTAEMLTDGDFWVVARPDVLANHACLGPGRELACLADVMDLPWVMESHMLSRRGLIEREGLDLGQVDLTVLTTSGLVQSAVLAGLGLTVQPKTLVEGLVCRGDLRRICTLRQPGVGYYMVTLPGRHPAGLAAFMRWLRASFGSSEINP